MAFFFPVDLIDRASDLPSLKSEKERSDCFNDMWGWLDQAGVLGPRRGGLIGHVGDCDARARRRMGLRVALALDQVADAYTHEIGGSHAEEQQIACFLSELRESVKDARDALGKACQSEFLGAFDDDAEREAVTSLLNPEGFDAASPDYTAALQEHVDRLRTERKKERIAGDRDKLARMLSEEFPNHIMFLSTMSEADRMQTVTDAANRHRAIRERMAVLKGESKQESVKGVSAALTAVLRRGDNAPSGAALDRYMELMERLTSDRSTGATLRAEFGREASAIGAFAVEILGRELSGLSDESKTFVASVLSPQALLTGAENAALNLFEDTCKLVSCMEPSPGH